MADQIPPAEAQAAPAPETPPKCSFKRWCRVCCKFTLTAPALHETKRLHRLARSYPFERLGRHRAQFHPYLEHGSSLRETWRMYNARRVHALRAQLEAAGAQIANNSDTDSDACSDNYLVPVLDNYFRKEPP